MSNSLLNFNGAGVGVLYFLFTLFIYCCFFLFFFVCFFFFVFFVVYFL